MPLQTKLNAIRDDAQVISEAISAIIGLETVIVDETLTVVAGTGRFKKQVGLKEEGGDLQAGYAYGRIITKGAPEIIEDAPNDPSYDPSVHAGTTCELAEICCPITGHGNPLACAAAIAAIKFTFENDLPAQIAQKGEYIMNKLKELQQRHPVLVDVRGKGLLIGLEYPTPEIGWMRP